MIARPQLPGARWFLWLHNVALRSGVLTGIYLSAIFAAWLAVANRLSWLDPFAGVRNVIAGTLMVLVLAIPVMRFRRQPGRLFAAGLTAWGILTLTYVAAELYFTLLNSRIGALHLFVIGALSYGLIAVFQWVFLMCAEVRQRHHAQSHQAAASAIRPRTR